MWNIHTIQYYSMLYEMSYQAMKIYRGKHCILLSESSQSGKMTYHMIPTLWHYRKVKTGENENSVVYSDGGFGGGENEVEWMEQRGTLRE